MSKITVSKSELKNIVPPLEPRLFGGGIFWPIRDEDGIEYTYQQTISPDYVTLLLSDLASDLNIPESTAWRLAAALFLDLCGEKSDKAVQKNVEVAKKMADKKAKRVQK